MTNTAENTETMTETNNTPSTNEVLVVFSKVKALVRSEAGMNTSASVATALSAAVKQLCLRAIENAKTDGRKTVMDRDFQGL